MQIFPTHNENEKGFSVQMTSNKHMHRHKPGFSKGAYICIQVPCEAFEEETICSRVVDLAIKLLRTKFTDEFTCFNFN